MMQPADAALAVELGADAVGMILHANARRKIDLATARGIVDAVNSKAETVGVCVDASAETLRELHRQTGVKLLQLHGQETPDVVVEISPIPVIKAIKVQRDQIEQTLEPWIRRRRQMPNLRALLLESAGAHSGGSGVANDFDLIAELISRGVFGDFPLIMAGGLNTGNVGSVVRRMHPYGVDTSSGIEETFGQKSPTLMRDFINQARQAAV